MQVLPAIEDFSRMIYLSVKAPRHYHEVGLLEPERVDPATGYRFYDASQVPAAQVIRRFRDLGMSLEDVKAVLKAPDVASRNEVIVAHPRRMKTHLEQTQASVASLPSRAAVRYHCAKPPRARERCVSNRRCLNDKGDNTDGLHHQRDCDRCPPGRRVGGAARLRRPA
jgi:DNA-binding transcriptional MerR regulator